jgi:hypothetical protein
MLLLLLPLSLLLLLLLLLLLHLLLLLPPSEPRIRVTFALQRLAMPSDASHHAFERRRLTPEEFARTLPVAPMLPQRFAHPRDAQKRERLTHPFCYA